MERTRILNPLCPNLRSKKPQVITATESVVRILTNSIVILSTFELLIIYPKVSSLVYPVSDSRLSTILTPLKEIAGLATIIINRLQGLPIRLIPLMSLSRTICWATKSSSLMPGSCR